ncbi:MAG: hypothetical protein QM775_32455 [Pirellulales bacterium]
MKPGITLRQARAQLALAADEFRQTYGGHVVLPKGEFAAMSLQDRHQAPPACPS